jgi:glycosyltransferase involved in cell wall biosynthesis
LTVLPRRCSLEEKALKNFIDQPALVPVVYKSMTLLHLITRLSLGGSARNTIDSAAAAVRAGYDTILATGPSGDEVDVTHLAEETGCRLAIIDSLRREISPLRDLRALLDTVRLIRQNRVAMVHTHTSKAGFIGRLAARLAGVPVIVHTSHGHIYYGYYGRARTAFFVALERWAATFSDRLIALTEDGMGEHLARGIGTRRQYSVIPSGVDTEALRRRAPTRRAAREKLGWEPEARIVVGVGRLVPIKGFDIAVRVPKLLAALPAIRLVLVGEGPERTRLEELASAGGVGDHLSITGAIHDVTPFLAAADVLVAPSRNEGMGRVLVEAMSLGVPVVAARVGGIASVVSHRRTGELVTPDDHAELARTLAGLLEDPARIEAYRAEGSERAERFSLRVMEQELLTLYRQLAMEKGLSLEAHANEPTPVLTTPR